MTRKKNGLLYEVHPTPAKGKDGRNVVYVRPARGQKLSMKQMDDFCSQNYGLRYGELTRAFDVFLRAAAEKMADGYRIETPIGSFAPKLSLRREITDPDDVRNNDVCLDGVDYQSGKFWDEALGRWLFNGFCRADNPNTQELMADKERLEQVLRKLLDKFGYTTARHFSANTSLTYYSARKQLDEWTKGNQPKLLKTLRGQQHIYTEV